ncbi:MAG: TolC family protein [bacterium]
MCVRAIERILVGQMRLCVLVCIFSVSCYAVHAVEAPADNLRLSLKDAVSRSLTKNPDIKQMETERLNSISNLSIANIRTLATAGVDTFISGTTGEMGTTGLIFGHGEYNALSGMDAKLDFAPVAFGADRASLGLEVGIPLTKGRGKLSPQWNTLEDAKSYLTIQNYETYLRRQKTVYLVVQSYMFVLLAQEETKVQEKSLEIARAVAEGARKRAAADLVTFNEVSRADVNVAKAEDELNRKRIDTKAAVDDLLIAIGERIETNVELTDIVPEKEYVSPDSIKAVSIALENRLELKQYDQQLVDKHRQLALSKDQLRNSLDIVAGYRSTNFGSSIFSDSLLNSDSARIGLQYGVILDKRDLREKTKINQRQLDLLADLRVYEADRIASEVRDACRAVDAEGASLRILSLNLQTARDFLKISQRLVEEGLASNREILDAQEALRQVAIGILSAKVSLYLAEIRLKLAMGEDLLETVKK